MISSQYYDEKILPTNITTWFFWSWGVTLRVGLSAVHDTMPQSLTLNQPFLPHTFATLLLCNQRSSLRHGDSSLVTSNKRVFQNPPSCSYNFPSLQKTVSQPIQPKLSNITQWHYITKLRIAVIRAIWRVFIHKIRYITVWWLCVAVKVIYRLRSYVKVSTRLSGVRTISIEPNECYAFLIDYDYWPKL